MPNARNPQLDPARALAGVALAIVLGACSALPANNASQSASPGSTPSAVPTASALPTATAVPTVTATPSPSLSPTKSPPPTAMPVAGPWRIHSMVVPSGDEEWAFLEGVAFLADGRAMALSADLSDQDPTKQGPLRSSLYDPHNDNWVDLAPPWDYQGYPGGLALIATANGGAVAVLSPGQNDQGTTQSATFDPELGAWMAPVDVPTNPPFTISDGVLLGDGRVLMFGFGISSTFVFDPATGMWDAGPTLPFEFAWARGREHAAIVLDDGSVLALSADGHAAQLPVGAASWARAGKASVGDNAYLAAIPGGAVALGGTTFTKGAIHSGPDPRTARFRADADRWSALPDAPSTWDGSVEGPGSGSAATLLSDGRLLVAGGWGAGTDYSCIFGAAILDLGVPAWQSIEPMPVCLGSGIGQLRSDGTVLIIGEGEDQSSDPWSGIGPLALTYQP